MIEALASPSTLAAMVSHEMNELAVTSLEMLRKTAETVRPPLARASRVNSVLGQDRKVDTQIDHLRDQAFEAVTKLYDRSEEIDVIDEASAKLVDSTKKFRDTAHEVIRN